MFNKPAGTTGFGTGGTGFGSAFGTSATTTPFGTNTTTSSTGLFGNQNKSTFSFGPAAGGIGKFFSDLGLSPFKEIKWIVYIILFFYQNIWT